MPDQEAVPVRAEKPAAEAAGPALYVPTLAPQQPPDGSEIWPPAARKFTALVAAIGIILLFWRGYGMSRWSTRPVPITRGAWLSPIDLNTATHADLRTIPGIGDKLAERIVEFRERNGPIRALEELRQVSGIGPQMIERLRLYVRIKPTGEPVPILVRAARPDPPADRPSGVRKVTPAGKVDITRATAEQLQTLPGIGPAMAARILEARGTRPFRAVEDLRRVKGIGAKTLEKLRPFVEVGPEP